MLVKTSSGNGYFFEVHDGNLWFSTGLIEGVVVSVKGLEIGSSMEIIYRKVGLYGKLESSTSLVVSSPIKSIA